MRGPLKDLLRRCLRIQIPPQKVFGCTGLQYEENMTSWMKWWHLPPLRSMSKDGNSPKSVFMFSTSFLWRNCFQLIIYKTSKIGLNEVRKFSGGFEHIWTLKDTINTVESPVLMQDYHQKYYKKNGCCLQSPWPSGTAGTCSVRSSITPEDTSGTWIYLIYLQMHYHKLTLAMISWVLCPTIQPLPTIWVRRSC